MIDGPQLLKGLRREDATDFERVVAAPGLAVQTFFRIKDRAGRVVPFVFNSAQRLVSSFAEKFKFILKYRKGGVSSQRIAEDLWICATRRNEHRILLTHTDDAAGEMLAERVNPFLSNCRVPLGGVSRDGMIIFPATNSRYYVGTAGSKKYGRGSDITGRHFSEYAHWASPDVVAGVDEALLDFADGLTETTANGHNFAKVDWDKACRGETRDKAVFLGWYMHEAHVSDASLLGPLTEEEGRLMQTLRLAPEQLAWRRDKLRNMQRPELFPQEYPAYPEEAFLSSGRPVFDWVSLLHHQELCAQPKWTGYVRDLGPDGPRFAPDQRGPLKVWRMPEAGHRYAIGADVAEGLADGAYSAAFVLDVGDGEQVAEWHGHIAPDLFGDALADLGLFYGSALVIPESWPGPGGTTTSHLINNTPAYPNVWQSPEISRPGWETNLRTKPEMIHALSAALRDFGLTIRSAGLLAELRAYIYTDKGLMEPSLGNYSDRVIAAAIAWFTTREMATNIDYYGRRRVTPFGTEGGVVSAPRWRGQMPGAHGE
jgi:hypothetical protein